MAANEPMRRNALPGKAEPYWIATTPATDYPKLEENITAFINHVVNMKPATIRGQYIKGIAVSATMSPGVRIQAA